MTDKASDTRVCGIVASVVTEADLPFVEEAPAEISEEVRAALAEIEQSEGTINEGAILETNREATSHPLQVYAATANPDLDSRVVDKDQMGKLVTLGAFSHCKVDADIVPIQVGDLLTTSPTRGHAQKVLDSQKAVGAIIGKALAGLENGKGTIPVLVSLQ